MIRAEDRGACIAGPGLGPARPACTGGVRAATEPEPRARVPVASGGATGGGGGGMDGFASGGGAGRGGRGMGAAGLGAGGIG